MPLRFPPARPAGNQIYFIGATNVPLEALDPALQRPGRMGRHVWFRTPTKHDREDIFNLYLGKVSHDPELDTDRARDELARITNGYSPAMVEQVCSMALTRAHHEGRLRVHARRHHRGDDDGRVGHRGRRRVRPRGDARRRDPRGRPRRRGARLPEGRGVDAHLDPHARRLARPPPGAREGGALQLLEARGDGASSRGRSARSPRSTSSTARTRPASAATSRARPAGRRGWSASPAWAPTGSS